MIPLIKIRATYLKRNLAKSIFFYLIIPIMILSFIIVYIIQSDPKGKVEMNPKQTFNYTYGADYYLFENSKNFDNITVYLRNTSLVVKDNDLGDKLVQYVKNKIGLDLTCYSDEKKLDEYSQNIVVLEYDKKKNSYKFTYKEKELYGHNTTGIFPFNTEQLSTLESSNVFKYKYDEWYNMTNFHNKIFLEYQAFFSLFLIETVAKREVTRDIYFNLGLNSFPESVGSKDYDISLEILLGYLISLQFTFMILNFGIQMLEEKEQKLEKFLERQGIKRYKYIFSWFINYIIVTLLANISCIFGGFEILETLFGIYVFSLVLFNLAIFAQILFIVTISKSKKVGIILIIIIKIGGFIIGFLGTMSPLDKVFQTIFNFFPDADIFCSIKLLIKLQFIGRYSIQNFLLEYNGISYLDTLIMFFIEIILYGFLALFIRAYQNSGLNFINFIKSICTKVERKTDLIIESGDECKDETNHEELSEKNQSLKDQNLYLNIKNVTRKYDDLYAVNNFNGELFKNEIFCLLGHNGAGKTTLIKMISGAEDPDNGDIFLNNISIVTNKKYLFQNIGLCQQEDIFFDYLTVYEHLKYMMEIKGNKSDLQQINTLITKIDLISKQNSICKTLSGGEKRKLCIALALIGNSQLVLLDEPTSGMDIISKRALWDFLKDFKNDKIIILTTHSLDEAEYLGDRIGIMTSGHYICSGTSSFLKSKYPCGFNLNLLINANIFTEDVKQKLYNELIEYEPKLEIKISSKYLFSLNIQSNNQNIRDIFRVITKYKEEYGIEDYTVSSTSLEDVFLKLNHKIEINEEEKTENENLIQVEDIISVRNIINQRFFPQLKSHIKRGYFSLWRNKGFSFLELFYSVFILYIYVIVYYTAIEMNKESVLSLTKLFKYNDVYICDNNKNFLKKSYVADDLCSISFKEVGKQTTNKEDFIENVYQKSFANIGKSGICINNIDSTNNDYEVINSEIPLDIPSYIMANSMLIVSAYLKKEYDINAVIFDEIINLKTTAADDLDFNQIPAIISINFACTLSLCIYLGTIVADKIKERVKNIKQILYLSGTNMLSYWCGFYVVDISKMLVFTCVGTPIIYLINNYASYIWIDLIIAILPSLSFIYVLSFLFDKEESAQRILIFIAFIIIMLIGLVLTLILALGEDFDFTFLSNRFNFTVLDITPFTSFLLSYIRISFSYYFFDSKLVPDNIEKLPMDYLDYVYRPKYYILTSLMTNSINFVFYTCLLLLSESGYIGQFFNYIKVKFCIKEKNVTFSNIQMSEEFLSINNYFSEGNTPLLEIKENKDIMDNNPSINDVNINNNIENKETNKNCIEKEISKINMDAENILTTKIVALKKTYWFCCKKNIRAINNLYLGLENREKFGLLGFNGSGKTTTFKSITKEILYDSGNIFLFGNNTKTQFNHIRQYIGYCPQENPLFDYMKVREIIKFYLSLKNIRESPEDICNKFGLEKFMDTYCVNLSGGNKRKLSFAIALMCKPKILLLDEPSTGVDPESRRIMWKNIMEVSKKREKFNMILTTHSMEEAEVLCDTVSWLKSGNFLSIGNPEKLKIELSAGYKLNIKFIKLEQDTNEIKENIGFDLNSNINGINNFSDLINSNKELQIHVKELEKVIDLIKDKCTEIVLQKINKDFSFEFNIHVKKENQSELFIQILDMKNSNKLLSEINISMESLENILTKL